MAVYPTARGFGWAAFVGSATPYDCGMVDIRGNDKNGKCIRGFERLVERLDTPDTLVLEAFESTRSRRIAELSRELMGLASGRGVEVALYSRADVATAFAPVGAVTRQQIAEAVKRQVPDLHYPLPRKRNRWDPEDKRMSVYCAAALILTHFHMGDCYHRSVSR